MRFHVECVTPARIGVLFFFTPPDTVNSHYSHCIRPSKVHLVFMKIFILTCQLSDVFSFLEIMFLHFTQCSSPEICVTFFTDATAGIYSLNSERKNSLRRFFFCLVKGQRQWYSGAGHSREKYIQSVSSRLSFSH